MVQVGPCRLPRPSRSPGDGPRCRGPRACGGPCTRCHPVGGGSLCWRDGGLRTGGAGRPPAGGGACISAPLLCWKRGGIVLSPCSPELLVVVFPRARLIVVVLVMGCWGGGRPLPGWLEGDDPGGLAVTSRSSEEVLSLRLVPGDQQPHARLACVRYLPLGLVSDPLQVGLG